MFLVKNTIKRFFSYYLDIVQNTFYKDRGARVRFTKLSNVLAKDFPTQKIEKLKYTLKSKWLSANNNYDLYL